ncbi:Modification methylase HphIA [Drechslerella dactyloides]|uniref:DNA (cytosine-5-)-methyltransferase n=1 Tax=Drechslerella dactyloides TaxID=74499 RepID=A0AAD6J435_DREDA|nr:Modification methylase HphIA [Drechslerella dactyloides]
MREKRKIDVVDLTSASRVEYNVVEDLDFDLFEIGSSISNTPKKRRQLGNKTPPKELPKNLTEYDGNFEELELRVGGCVELAADITLLGETEALTDGYFLHINRVLTSHEGQFLVGPLFKRARWLYGLCDRIAGELVWLRDTAIVDATDIVRVRELILTNHTESTCDGIFPREDADYDRLEDNIGRLICRRRAFIADNARDTTGSANMVLGKEAYIRMLRENEADEGFRFSAKSMKRNWMEHKEDNIKKEKAQLDSVSIDLTVPEITSNSTRTTIHSWTTKQTKRTAFSNHGKRTSLKESTTTKSTVYRTSSEITQHDILKITNPSSALQQTSKTYTFGDFFCGAGGASCGARLAGLKVMYGIDLEPNAVNSYAANFGKNRAFSVDICEFAAEISDVKIPASRLHCDVIHLSCPCQFFSPAHTRPGKDDSKNESASLAIDKILKLVRPRAVTLEQTFGLSTARRFRSHFTTVVDQLVRNGYSVRWGVKDATDPGEEPPRFPAATSFNPFQRQSGINIRGLPTTPTIGEVLRSIPHDAENHTPKFFPTPRVSSYRLDQPFNRTITCDGGGNKVHPNGRRNFTPREFASFQTFPTDYKFRAPSDNKILKLIGNAWPPRFAQSIFEAVVKQLEKLDRNE